MAWVGALLVVASCGKIAGDESVTSGNDPHPDAGAIVGDAGKQAQDADVPATIADASIPFLAIDTSGWALAGAQSSCSFELRFDEENAPPYSVTGQRLIARIEGTEIPYVGFGCSGKVAGMTVTFVGGTFDYDGTHEPQWAYIDWGSDSFVVDDAHITAECDLSEQSASFGVIGSEVSGTFSCTNVPGSPAPVSIINGKFDTVFSMGELGLANH